MSQKMQERGVLLKLPNQRAPRRFGPVLLLHLPPEELELVVRGAIQAMPREPGITRG